MLHLEQTQLRVLALAALTIGCLARDAKADTSASMGEARQLASRAQVHFDLGEYEQAVVAYREAYRLVPSPGLLYNLGQAYRLMGDCVAATTMYRNYLRLAPRSEYRSMVRRHLTNLEDCYQERTGGGVILATVHGGSGSLPEFRLVDKATSAPSGHKKKIAGLTFAGVGAGLAAVGVYFAADASSAATEVSRLYDEHASWMDIAEVDARGRRSETLAASFLVGGAVAITTGAALYYLGWRVDRRASTFAVGPTSHGGAVASVGWSF
jgi:tetratricopeptide (TPR) repeat protein